MGQTLALSALEARGVPVPTSRKLAADVAGPLSQGSAWPIRVAEATGTCSASDKTCLLGQAEQLRGDSVVLLQLLRIGKVRVHYIEPSEKKVVTRLADTDDPAAVARVALELFPTHGLKGFGAVTVDVPEGATLRLDGRAQSLPPQGRDLPVPAGAHEVDVTLPSGDLLLQPFVVAEGSRQRVSFPLTLPVATSAPASHSTLRLTAYGLWSGAAVSVGAALLCGALSRFALRDRGLPCGATDRDCVTQDAALSAQARAQNYARNGNIFLGVGAGLAAAGAGVFTFDVLGGKK